MLSRRSRWSLSASVGGCDASSLGLATAPGDDSDSGDPEEPGNPPSLVSVIHGLEGASLKLIWRPNEDGASFGAAIVVLSGAFRVCVPPFYFRRVVGATYGASAQPREATQRSKIPVGVRPDTLT